MIRVADYIAQRLKSLQTNCYMVTGGGAMHLNDAFGRSGINLVYCHHEQACSIAAEAEARITKQPAIVNVTTGPGGINALNGVFGAYVDSIPMVIVSGQVKRETLVRNYEIPWRQLGDQEVDIVRMAEGVTKYAVCIMDPSDLRYHLEKAIFLANTGRPGPVWIDVPIDVQAMQIDPEIQRGFDPTVESSDKFDFDLVQRQIAALIERLHSCKRPVFYIGSGIHISDTQSQFLALAERLNIPVVTAWNANDLIDDEHPLYVGRGGTIGNRSGNFVLQSADLVIVLGTRLNIRLVSYNWSSFAPNAFKVAVDIDQNEMNKPTCKFDLKIHASLQYFIPQLNEQILDKTLDISTFNNWVVWGKERLKRYPVCLEEYWGLNERVNPYCFIDILFSHLKEDQVVVCADGTACVVTFQGMKVKKGQRIFHNSGCASMGYEIPAAIGAYLGQSHKKKVISIAGDGSMMMNLQELQTISGNDYPIQIFVLNNQGYHSIRQTQRNFFSDNIVGCGLDSGLTFPSFSKIATAFDFPYFEIKNHADLKDLLPEILKSEHRFICEIHLDLDQQFSPKLSSKKLPDGSMVTSPLEDMWPFLGKDELMNNIIKD
jgi:acetolactate synthase-1/2/3 large subunit